jgi:Prophage tail length tape measure protein
MTEERIDIEIVDKVSPTVAKRIQGIGKAARDTSDALTRLQADINAISGTGMAKLANEYAKVTNAQARQAASAVKLATSTARLDTAAAKSAIAQEKLATQINRTDAAKARAVAAASRTEIATVRLATATERLNGTAAKSATSLQKLATEISRTGAAASRADAEMTRASTAVIQQETAVVRLAQAKDRESNAIKKTSDELAKHNALRVSGARSQRQQLQQTQNIIYQLNDIVVGLASGQKPMTVLLQQGSQLSTVFGPGNGILGTFKKLGSAIFNILKPLLPIAAVVGIIAGGIAMLNHEISKSTGVSTTFGDTFKAIFQVAGHAIYELLQPAVKSISPWFTEAYNFIKDGTKTIINDIIGGFVFAFNAIRKTWHLLPGALKDIMSIAVNSVISAVEFMINGTLSGINKVIKLANEASIKLGKGALFTEINNVDLSGYKLKVGDTLAEVAAIVKAEAKSAFNEDYAGAAFTAISKQAVKNAKERMAAEDEGKKATKALKEELSDTEKLYQDIKAPMVEYIKTLDSANRLLRDGRISLSEYQNALDKTQLSSSLQSVDSALTVRGGNSDAAALEEMRRAQTERTAIVKQAVDARLITEQEGVDRIRAINEQLALDQMNYEAEKNSVVLQSAEASFNSMADAAAVFAGKQSGIYRTMFIASKAFAIADSIIKIQQGVANALALPFPANLAAVASVAAAAASIVSTIQSVQFNAQGKKDGGFIAGPGGPRDDRVPIWASNGEFIVNAAATRKNRPLLEALNDNTPSRYRDGGIVAATTNNVGTTNNKIITNRGNNVTVNISTPNARSFMESRNQVSAAMARAVNEGYRNL